tara:strand:+ start:567 stop:761 length:195 start_codon:yes stop_codon:yes gene_type:complete
MLRVDGHKNLYRDDSSGAIVNTDTVSYKQYMRLKEKKKNEKEDIDRLRSELDEIKSLLKELQHK